MATDTKSPPDPLTEWQEELAGPIAEAQQTLAEAGKGAVAFLKERPVLCLVGAFAAGYLIGRIVRR
jgi:hypothetical protein